MNKFFTLLLGLACATALNAQNLTVTVNGNPVANGATVSAGNFEIFGGDNGYWTCHPEAFITCDEDLTVILEAKVPTLSGGNEVQFCPYGLCRTPVNGIAEASVNLVKDTPLSFETHLDVWSVLATDPCPTDIKADVEISVYYRLKKVFSFTLAFDSSNVGAINAVENEEGSVKLAGNNILEYNLPASTKLSIYSLNGSTVLQRTVNGHGSLSLDRLAAGVYLYKAGTLSGKLYVK